MGVDIGVDVILRFTPTYQQGYLIFSLLLWLKLVVQWFSRCEMCERKGNVEEQLTRT